MVLFGTLVLILGLVCTAGTSFATKRFGPTGGMTGPDAEERAGQYRTVAIGTAVFGGVVLAVDLLYVALT